MQKSTKEKDRLLTTKEAAKMLHVVPQTLVNWRGSKRSKRHNVPYVKIGRKVYYRLSDLQAWLESCVVSD